MSGQREGLVVWNILTAAVWWWLPLSATCIAADGLGTGGLAVGLQPQGGFPHKEGSTAPGTVALFNAASPKPIQVSTTLQRRPSLLSGGGSAQMNRRIPGDYDSPWHCLPPMACEDVITVHRSVVCGSVSDVTYSSSSQTLQSLKPCRRRAIEESCSTGSNSPPPSPTNT